MIFLGPLRPSRETLFWAAFSLAVVAAWAALLGMSLGYSGPLGELGPGMGLLESLRGLGQIGVAGAEPQRWEVLWAMWALMALAMMGPAAVPYLVAYARLGSRAGQTPSALALAALAAGYLAVWVAYACVAAALQSLLAGSALLAGTGIRASPWFAALLLAMAAVWQWTVWKRACLARCRNPLFFFVSSWRSGATGAFAMGVRQGLACAGCCWALMLLALVGGVMNVLWMAGATALMVAEKFPDPGERVRRVLGAGLTGGALAVGLAGAGLL